MKKMNQSGEEARAAFLAALAGAQFAMEPEALEAFIARVEAPGAFLFSDDDPEPLGYELIDSTALISMRGPLVNRAGFFDRMMGAVSTQNLVRQVAEADADPAVSRIILSVDSPGGMVDGLTSAAAAIRGTSKSIEAHVEGVCASAAYWLASATDRITASATSRVGSIGAISVMRQRSDDGAVTFVSSQSPLKNARLDTSAGRGVYQQVVDDLAEVFIASISSDRGISRADVLKNYGQGAIMVAARALEAGLIDQITGVSTQMEEQLKALAAERDALNAQLIEARAQIVELSAQAEAVTASAAQLAEIQAEQAALAAQLAETKTAKEQAEALAAEQAAQLSEARAEQHALSRAAAVDALLRSGRISAAEKPGAEMAYDLEAADPAKAIFTTAFKARAENSAVNLEVVGHSASVSPKDGSDPDVEAAKRLRDETPGMTFQAAYTEILKSKEV